MDFVKQTERSSTNIEFESTPGPGSYDLPHFLDDWDKRVHSSQASFKNKGRESPIFFISSRDGRYLEPGRYEHKDVFLKENQRRASCMFKVTSRDHKPGSRVLSRKQAISANADLCPGMYNTEKYLSIGNLPPNTPPTYHFRSKIPRSIQRVVSSAFNPGPGNYSLPSMVNTSSGVTSSFCSKTARFKTPANKVPGPGTYDRCIQTPAAAESLTKIGKLYGLFFPIDYYP